MSGKKVVGTGEPGTGGRKDRGGDRGIRDRRGRARDKLVGVEIN